MLSCPLCNDTLWPRQCEYCLEITQLQFLDTFVMPSLCNDRCPVSCGQSTDAVLGQGFVAPSLLCLVLMARQRRKPVETPQVQFLDKFDMPVVLHDSALVQMSKKLWSSTVAFFDEVGMPVVVQRQVPWFAWQSSWTRLLPCPLLCASRVQTRRILCSTVACSSLTRCSCPSLCMDKASLVQTVQIISGGAAVAFRPAFSWAIRALCWSSCVRQGVALTPEFTPRCQASGVASISG